MKLRARNPLGYQTIEEPEGPRDYKLKTKQRDIMYLASNQTVGNSGPSSSYFWPISTKFLCFHLPPPTTWGWGAGGGIPKILLTKAHTSYSYHIKGLFPSLGHNFILKDVIWLGSVGACL